MHFLTHFSPLAPTPSRARKPISRKYGSRHDAPIQFAPAEASGMLVDAAKQEFPYMPLITISDMSEEDFTLENVCKRFNLDPEIPFCVCNDHAERVALDRLPPEARYKDGFPLPCDQSFLDIVCNLACECGLREQIPDWIEDAFKFHAQNTRDGVFAPFMLTYQQARDFFAFFRATFHSAEEQYDSCMIESILASYYVGLQYLVFPERELVGPGTSWMYSAPVIDRIIDCALCNDNQPRHLPFLLENMITEQLPFWVHAGGITTSVQLEY